ncbi:hypothetical protein E2C01_051755 [Portunus trituberculatus]|uniref:Uncharacterized protein n=1 Tax=Portunus trituberculatus TaxID=210409 RepID=A0A5B7GLC1_PORTR|nr:hypothetical protein [Portunus trituberculatus]
MDELVESITPEEAKIQDFQLFHRLRSERRGEGVAVYCRSIFSPLHLPVVVPPGVETLWVRVTPPSHPRNAALIILCVVNHPPRAPTAQLLTEHIISTAVSCCEAGDMQRF